MDKHDAASTMALCANLWRFIGGKSGWNATERQAFIEGLWPIPVNFKQAEACLIQMKRSEERTPTCAAMLRKLWALVPSERTISPPVREPDSNRGPLMDLQEFVSGVMAGRIDPCPDSTDVPEPLRHHLDLSKPDSALSVLARSMQDTGTCSLNQILAGSGKPLPAPQEAGR